MTLFQAFSFAQSNKVTEDKVISALKKVEDPELHVNVYDLGLILEIKISEQNHVHIQMIFTKLFCPYGKTLVRNIKKEVNALPAVENCKVTVDIQTRWKRSMMTEAGKKQMEDIFSW